MSVSEATVDLLFKASNLAGAAISDVTSQIKGIGSAGVAAAGKFATAFKGMGNALANSIGNSVENLTTGGDLGPTLLMAGGYMAGQLAEQFGGSLIERLASSGLVTALAAPLGVLGTAIGGIVAAAIPIGMAALPFILIGAIVAAIAVLIVNPEIRGKVFDFVGGLIGKIGDALGALAGLLADIIPKAFGAAFKFVIDSVIPFIGKMIELWLTLPLKLAGLGFELVKTIVGGLAGLPGKIADIIGNAFRSLKLDIGPFHISGGGVTIDLPKIDIPHFAVGTPFVPADMLAVVHRGEAVIPAAQNPFTGGGGGGGGRGFTIQGVSERDIVDMVERGLYFRMQRAGTGRT